MNLVVVEMVGVVVVMIMIVTGVAQCANDGKERACAVVAERIAVATVVLVVVVSAPLESRPPGIGGRGVTE